MKDKSGTKSEGVDGVYIGKRGGDDETTYTIIRPKVVDKFRGEVYYHPRPVIAFGNFYQAITATTLPDGSSHSTMPQVINLSNEKPKKKRKIPKRNNHDEEFLGLNNQHKMFKNEQKAEFDIELQVVWLKFSGRYLSLLFANSYTVSHYRYIYCFRNFYHYHLLTILTNDKLLTISIYSLQQHRTVGYKPLPRLSSTCATCLY